MALLPDEPALEAHEIQGHVLIGFGSAEQAIGAFTGTDLEKLGQVLGGWARKGRITSAYDLFPRKGMSARRALSLDVVPGPWIAAAVSHRLLGACGLANDFDDEWFKVQSMAAIGELEDARPANGGAVGGDWVVGAPGTPVDMLLIVAAGEIEAAFELVDWFERDVGDAARLTYREALQPIKGSKEHFGFRDGISQPGLLGTIDGQPFEKERQADTGPIPYAKLGQQLVWPGEFVFGYAQQGLVPKRPGRLAAIADEATNAVARNGSYVVFRRLQQNVARFRAFCEEQVEKHREQLGADYDRERFEASLVGRWQSGVPLAGPRTKPFDDATDNDFDFVDDAMQHGCPAAAHIRKVNPRLLPMDQRTVPRLLRRGAPYGTEYDQDETEPPERGRGLAFLAYMSSIQHQFGTITAKWMNDGNKPTGGGHDMIVGQRGKYPRTFSLPAPSGTTVPVCAESGDAWVRTTGGAFLLTPSISTLQALARPEEDA